MGFPSPYEGAPHGEGILKGGLKDWQRGPYRADPQRKVSTTSIKIVIIFRGEMFRAGTHCTQTAQWEESFSKHLYFAIVIVFWLKWSGYLAVAGLILDTLLSYRIV